MKEEINKILNQALSGEHQAVKDYCDWAIKAESLSEPKTAKLFQEIGHEEEHHAAELTQEIREMVDRAEDIAIRDVIISAATSEGAIPLYGRENRKEPCKCCKIDNKLMCTTSDAIGILSQKEVKEWCSEIIEVPDGRCERAKKIKEAARECKEKYAHTAEFWECYAPAFSKITRGSNPGTTPVTPEVTAGQYAKITFKGAEGKQQTKLVKFIHEKGTRRFYRVVDKEGGIIDELVVADKADLVETPMRMNLKYGELEAIPKAEAGMSEEQRKELLERGIIV